jgi:hypothetical protein
MAGLKLAPLPGCVPSAEIETSTVDGAVLHATVDDVQTTFQKTWLSVPVNATVLTRFVAFEVNAIFVPAVSRLGS